ncbi:PTS sugar transporter subunit IIA [Candidatus Latescibacterota bacterium]
MIKGFIVGHKNIGDGLLKALESISGPFENIFFFSNNGLSTSELADKICAACNDCDDEVMILVDVFGGSCWRAAKMAKLPRCHIVTGLNLPMLLSFVNKRKTFSFDELYTIIENDGKRGIISE